MALIGLLHTSEAHVERFAALFEEILPDATLLHLVREDLLVNAQLAGGLTPEIEVGTRESLGDLAERGAAALLCTCSTLGPAVEAATLELPVVRVDRPMAEAAVAAGARILVVAVLETTLAPTQALLEDAAARAGRSVSLGLLALPEAWEAFEAGDQEAYERQIAEAVRGRAEGFDAVVLAQASMAGAAEALSDLDIPVLSSPRLAVESTAELYSVAAERSC